MTDWAKVYDHRTGELRPEYQARYGNVSSLELAALLREPLKAEPLPNTPKRGKDGVVIIRSPLPLVALVEAGAARSNSEARRLIWQNGVHWNNALWVDPKQPLTFDNNNRGVFRIGKRKQIEVELEQ